MVWLYQAQHAMQTLSSQAPEQLYVHMDIVEGPSIATKGIKCAWIVSHCTNVVESNHELVQSVLELFAELLPQHTYRIHDCDWACRRDHINQMREVREPPIETSSGTRIADEHLCG